MTHLFETTNINTKKLDKTQEENLKKKKKKMHIARRRKQLVKTWFMAKESNIKIKLKGTQINAFKYMFRSLGE